jgi:hypothetical protein
MRPVLEGHSPRQLQLRGGDPRLDGLYDVAPAGLDEEFLLAIGVLATLDDADADEILARLVDPACVVGRRQLRALNAWLAGQELAPPDRVRAVRGTEVVVVAAADAVIVDAPDLLPLLGDLALVPVAVDQAAALADRLDLPLASELGDFPVTSAGTVDGDSVAHEGLRVADVDGIEQAVAWRFVDDKIHVDAGQRAVGLGRGRAWRDGEWDQRHRLTEALNHPSVGTLTDDEDDLDADR